jgi:hypothetical protein
MLAFVPATNEVLLDVSVPSIMAASSKSRERATRGLLLDSLAHRRRAPNAHHLKGDNVLAHRHTQWRPPPLCS